MNSNDFIFTSYCFGNKAAEGDYLPQQIRLKDSIYKIYPDANIHFSHETEEIGKPKFQKSLYGYKVGLVRDCLALGFKKIIYFDTAICLEQKVDYWMELVKEHGVLAAVDRQTLDGCTSDKALRYVGLSREAAKHFNLCGGSIYVFDFNVVSCQLIFDEWQKMEGAGLLGTQAQIGSDQNHRMDESCMALAMARHNVKPLGHDVMRYAYIKPDTPNHLHGPENAIVIKRHFK